MTRSVCLILAGILLAGCGSSPPRERQPVGNEADAPIGPDGTIITNSDRYRRDMQRLLGIAKSDPDLIIVEHIYNPLKRPTVTVKYAGNPPRGILKNVSELFAYRRSYMDGNQIVYNSDLGQMTLILERLVKNQPYDYRELTMVIPYAMCLDFLEENLGRERDDYILRKVTCDQDNLGHDY